MKETHWPRNIDDSEWLFNGKYFVSLIQLPNGVTQSQAMYQDRFGKLQEHLRQLSLFFRKLRLLYERCVEMTADLQEGPAEVRELTASISYRRDFLLPSRECNSRVAVSL